MKKVHFVYQAGSFTVTTPYSEEFVSGAKSLGGKWNRFEKEWKFDFESLENVRALCMKIFGESGKRGGKRPGAGRPKGSKIHDDDPKAPIGLRLELSLRVKAKELGNGSISEGIRKALLKAE